MYSVNADGAGEVTRLTDGPEGQAPWSWHPTGKFLAFFAIAALAALAAQDQGSVSQDKVVSVFNFFDYLRRLRRRENDITARAPTADPRTPCSGSLTPSAIHPHRELCRAR